MVGYSLDNTRRALKNLFLFLSENGSLSDLSEFMNKLCLFKIPVEKKIKPFMPQDEIAAVLNIIDRKTAKGKRDYAMILLAAITGLRSVDITKLTLDSIDWCNGEIKIVQEKTGASLALPLTTDVGESIYEYITKARPKSKSDKVFLRTISPFDGLSNAIRTDFRRYCDKAGLSTKRGFHSLRRSIATNMITSGVSVFTVAQSLGHTTIDSTRPYISLDSQNLKECALDFSGIRVGGDEL
jgi:integrase